MKQFMMDRSWVLILLSAALLFGCEQPLQAAASLPAPKSDLPAGTSEQQKTVVFGAGCFWCVEAVFEQLEGVSNVVSGYAGGTKETADYKKVSEGSTNHAEVVQITYDPKKISYGKLLQVLFTTHDPTTKDRQGPDWGKQYRSAIFYANEEEKRVAEAYIQQLNAAKVFPAAIVTTLEPLEAFYPAEEYHQDFVTRNPGHPYVQRWAVPKVAKTKKEFKEQLKTGK